MKNAVVTVAVGKGLEWLEISEPGMRAYAERVGAEFVVLKDVTCPPFPEGEKWQVEPLFDQFDRILFVDADLVIRPGAPNLFELVPESHVGLHDDYDDLKGWAWMYAEYEQIQKDQRFPIRPLHTCYNTGLVMASRQHRDIWKQPNFFRPSHTYEQSLINLKVREAGWKVFRLSREIHWQWWSDTEFKHYGRGQFLHFSGTKDFDMRIRLMREAASLPAVEAKKAGCSSCSQRRRMVR